ncbi:MAG: potassium channel family protein [Gammaproteobacteria bacterium]|nr:potassium channel family protein [Gammaproteobacteria bacterium]
MRLRQGRTRLQRFSREIIDQTPFIGIVVLLVVAWSIFAAALYFAESNAPGTSIRNYGDALYWCVAAFTTAGIADRPLTGLGRLFGAAWMVTGSILFFGAIVATITAYFMRPLQRPAKKIIDTIEYNLERLDDLSVEELELLKGTTDGLIVHMEKLLKSREKQEQIEKKRDAAAAKNGASGED